MSTTTDFSRIQTKTQLVATMRDAGSHYWDADTMRFFDSHGPFSVKSTKRGVYFITSEQFHGSDGVSGPRRWTVRLWTGDDVSECGEFQAHATLRDAMRSLRRFASGLPT